MFRGQILSIANRVEQIDNKKHYRTDEERACLLIPGLVNKRLEAENVVVINDGSNNRVVGLRKTSETKYEIIEINRYGGYKAAEVKTLINPVFSAEFIRNDFKFQISANGESFEISSDGNSRPRPFTITTETEVLLARVDCRNSLSFVWEHQNSDQNYWVVRRDRKHSK